MICEVASGAIRSALNILTSVTNPRSFSVKARNILLTARDGRLRMCSTDSYVWLQYDVDASVQESGSVAVPAREFQAIVNNLPDTTLRLQTQSIKYGSQFLIEFVTGKYWLPASDGDAFPMWGMLESAEMTEDYEVDTAALARAIRKVMFAALRDPTGGVYAGVHLRKDVTTSTLDVVATDAYRVAKVTLQDKELPNLALTIPSRDLKYALPLLEKFSPMAMVCKATVVGWRGDTCEIYLRAWRGDYPPYHKVIPSGWAHEVVVNKDEMLTALRRMRNVLKTDMRTTSQRVELHAREYDLTISAQIMIDETGYESVGEEYLKIGWHSEPSEFRVALQCHFLLDFFNVVRDTQVVLCLQDDPHKPVLLYPASDPAFVYLVMPLRSVVSQKD